MAELRRLPPHAGRRDRLLRLGCDRSAQRHSAQSQLRSEHGGLAPALGGGGSGLIGALARPEPQRAAERSAGALVRRVWAAIAAADGRGVASALPRCRGAGTPSLVVARCRPLTDCLSPARRDRRSPHLPRVRGRPKRLLPHRPSGSLNPEIMGEDDSSDPTDPAGADPRQQPRAAGRSRARRRRSIGPRDSSAATFDTASEIAWREYQRRAEDSAGAGDHGTARLAGYTNWPEASRRCAGGVGRAAGRTHPGMPAAGLVHGWRSSTFGRASERRRSATPTTRSAEPNARAGAPTPAGYGIFNAFRQSGVVVIGTLLATATTRDGRRTGDVAARRRCVSMGGDPSNAVSTRFPTTTCTARSSRPRSRCARAGLPRARQPGRAAATRRRSTPTVVLDRSGRHRGSSIALAGGDWTLTPPEGSSLDPARRIRRAAMGHRPRRGRRSSTSRRLTPRCRGSGSSRRTTSTSSSCSATWHRLRRAEHDRAGRAAGRSTRRSRAGGDAKGSRRRST